MQDYAQVVCNELGICIESKDHEEIVEFFETVLLQHQPLLIPNAADAVRNAKARLKVGLVCDTGYSPGTTLRKIMVLMELKPVSIHFPFPMKLDILNRA